MDNLNDLGCRTPFHKVFPKHHGHKGDPGVTHALYFFEKLSGQNFAKVCPIYISNGLETLSKNVNLAIILDVRTILRLLNINLHGYITRALEETKHTME